LSGYGEAVIYSVTILAPAIDEVVTLSADGPGRAQAIAWDSAMARQRAAAEITVTEVPPAEEATEVLG
jgi:hypothetical protein